MFELSDNSGNQVFPWVPIIFFIFFAIHILRYILRAYILRAWKYTDTVITIINEVEGTSVSNP